MYKLIIVDDEEEIREGLADMIDWISLGFTVAEKLQDGSHAIEYLKSREVDVVLSDIKMTFVNGIDLAKYVYDNKLRSRVVLLSGFQEFALAREAIKYEVSHYLLKPTDLDEVMSVFRDIRGKLDEERSTREEELRQRQSVRTLKPLLLEQYFTNLMDGSSSSSTEDISRRFRQLGLDIDPDGRACCTMKAEWSETDSGSSAEMMREAQQSLSLSITKEQEQVHYSCIHVNGHQIMIIGNALTELSANDFQKRSEQFFIYVQHTMSSLLGIRVTMIKLNIYPSMKQMLDTEQEEKRLPSQVVAEVEASDPEEAQHERIIITLAKQFIAEHFDKDLTLADVAEHIGLSPVYFSRLFKQETGENYSDYVIRIRMRKAVEYLKNPRYKVYEIGFLVGYKDTKHFHKLFKSQMGLTPTEYRDKL